MKALVVGSEMHEASMNILKQLGEVEDVLVCESSIVELKELTRVRNRLILVASPHSSSAGVMSLSIHSPGNFGKAKVGGAPRKLSIAPAVYLGEGLRKFKEIKEREGLEHVVTLEVTHHGPTLDLPIVFVELGSDEKGWASVGGAKAAAEVIRHLLDLEPSGEALVGVGGPHYAPSFTKLTLSGRNFGHICPKYALPNLDGEMLVQMVEKTTPRPEKLVIEWKGVPGRYRENIIRVAEEMGLVIEKLR
jgi:D-aminoacyl-tRNA deacylase